MSSSSSAATKKRSIEPVTEKRKTKRSKQAKDQQITELKDALEEANRKVCALAKSLDILDDFCCDFIRFAESAELKEEFDNAQLCSKCYLFDVDCNCDVTPSDDDEDSDTVIDAGLSDHDGEDE